MYDVVALGELIIDFAQKSLDEDGYPTMQANPGGAPANFLGTLASFGKSTAFIGKVGDDAFGNLLISTVKKYGIELKGLVRDDDYFTTLAFVTIDADGDREFSFARKPGADTQLSFEEVNASLIENCKVFHFGTLSLTTDPIKTATQKSVAFAKAMGKIISFDPNLRAPLWNRLQDAKEQMLWGLEQANFVKINDEEVDFLWNCSPKEGGDKILNEYGADLVLVTLGAKGMIAMNKKSCVQVECPKVNPIDTTGAGDICGASAMNCILDLNKSLSDLSKDELLSIAKFATTAASLSTEKYGSIPSIPDKATVLDIVG